MIPIIFVHFVQRFSPFANKKQRLVRYRLRRSLQTLLGDIESQWLDVAGSLESFHKSSAASVSD